MASPEPHPDQPKEELAADLRRAFSAIVAGNVKDEGIRRIRDKGVFTTFNETTGRIIASVRRTRPYKLPGSVTILAIKSLLIKRVMKNKVFVILAIGAVSYWQLSG